MYFLVFLTGYIFQWFNKKILFWIFAVILSLMAFMRYGIGLDYFGYQFLYERLQPSVLDEMKYGLDHQEIGFRAIGAFLKSIGFSYQQYLIFFAAITIFYVVKICKNYSKNPTLSLLIFFCFYYLTWTFTGVRQGVVLAIGIYYLLKCIENNKTWRYILIVLLLSLIHSSAFMLLVLYFASKINFNKKTLLMLTGTSILLSVIPTGLIISKMTWLPFYWRVYPYLNMEFSLNFLDFQGLGRLAFLFIAFYCYDEYVKQNEISKKILNIYVISLLMYFILQFSELSAARLSIYGQYLDMIILANLLYLFKQPINRLIYIYAIFTICFMYLFKGGVELERGFNEIGSESILTPYVHILNKGKFTFSSDYVRLINGGL